MRTTSAPSRTDAAALRESGGARSLLRKLRLALVAFALALLCCEGALHLILPAQSRVLDREMSIAEMLEPDPVCGWRTRPRQNAPQQLPGRGHVVIRTNSGGFRDTEHSRASADGRPRIVVLGDSFVFGYGVENDETLTSRLQERLPRAEVINLGVTGFNLVQSHRLLEEEGLDYRPQLVCLALCQNDVTRQVVPRLRRTKGPRPASGLKSWLSRNVRLYMLARNAVGRSRLLTKAFVNLGLVDPLGGYDELDWSLRPSLVEWPAQLAEAWTESTEELLAMRDACGSRGATFVVALIPALQSVNRSALEASLRYSEYQPEDLDMDKPYRLLEEFCADHGIPCVGALEPFRAKGADLYIPGDMHFNAAGHRLFATRIAGLLDGLLPDEED